MMMLGRRRRRYPSLQAFVNSLHRRRQEDRRGPLFVLFTARRWPTTKSLHPASSVLPGGPRGIQPIIIRPRTDRHVTDLICNSFSVMTVCNTPLWEYSGDNPGVCGHKRPYIGTLGARAPINTPVQCPWEARLIEQSPSQVKPYLHPFYSPVGLACPGVQVPTNDRWDLWSFMWVHVLHLSWETHPVSFLG
jgi:hypothetical protein